MKTLIRLVTRVDEVLGAGRFVSDMTRADDVIAHVPSLDELRTAVVSAAVPGQPIGVFRSGTGYDLSVLNSSRRAAPWAAPHAWPQLGGLTFRAESVSSLDAALAGVTYATTHGRLGRLVPAGIVPNGAAFN